MLYLLLDHALKMNVKPMSGAARLACVFDTHCQANTIEL